ncbi:Lrp/AsnC family transcriptional regulator [Bradyrhizobium diazoefficiens]|nr:Lrp/AsnC family transcriptional regulator [Bradyrhizobium diazoefficiens]QQO23690.1 Lrp/AsnC family transcriptional regulator [Bradyrhizobium diazoefficiens]
MPLPLKLDAIDLKILMHLQHDASLSNVDLAARVGLSPSPCLARVKQLEACGIILRRVTLLDPARFGSALSVFIHVALEKQTEGRLHVFEKAMTNLPEVMECYLMSGDSDYLLRVIVRDVVSLQQFIVEKLAKTSGVANIRSSFALKQVKYNTELPIDTLVDFKLNKSGNRNPR